MRKLPLAFVLTVVLSASVSINILQARYIWVLRSNEEKAAAQDASLVGTKLPPLEVQTLADKPSRITYDSELRPTILYIFRPTCHWCERNAKLLAALQRATSGNYRMLAISLDREGVEEFQQSHDMNLAVFVTPSQSSFSNYRLGSTPQTIVLSPSGVVLARWTGSYVGRVKTAIQKYFGIAM